MKLTIILNIGTDINTYEQRLNANNSVAHTIVVINRSWRHQQPARDRVVVGQLLDTWRIICPHRKWNA